MLFVQVEPRRMASLKALKEPIKASDDVPKAQISKPVLKTAETKPKPKKKAKRIRPSLYFTQKRVGLTNELRGKYDI
ncbi:hypothetical protein M6B38_413100 [Iris pallida]|uniref:Uncharacterized protein n=1 Tax=Iris pallida TaxID=29817 RepID=A0AAX6FL48_IRIPA|nr:hypothetical protein M6B38_413100 [Iris pallida]